MDRRAGVRRERAPRPSARRDRIARPVLPGPDLAAHPRIRPAGLGQGRRGIHREPDEHARPDRVRRDARARARRIEENTMGTTTDLFPTDPAGLTEARAPELVELSDGDEFDLRIAPVAKRLGDTTVRMLAYNGSIPGPILKVKEGSEV